MDYPVTAPGTEMKMLFDMLTGKTEADLSDALHAGWVVQGYLQGLIWPEDQEFGPQVRITTADGGKVPKLSDSEAVQVLGALAGKRGAQGEVKAQGLVGDFLGKKLKSELAKVLLPTLLSWLQKWAAGGGLESLIRKILGDSVA